MAAIAFLEPLRARRGRVFSRAETSPPEKAESAHSRSRRPPDPFHGGPSPLSFLPLQLRAACFAGAGRKKASTSRSTPSTCSPKKTPRTTTSGSTPQAGFSEAQVAAAEKDLFVFFDRLESVLDQHQWLVADQYSYADIAWFVQYFLMSRTGVIDFANYPQLRRWAEDVMRRPAFEPGIRRLQPWYAPVACAALKLKSRIQRGGPPRGGQIDSAQRVARNHGVDNSTLPWASSTHIRRARLHHRVFHKGLTSSPFPDAPPKDGLRALSSW